MARSIPNLEQSDINNYELYNTAVNTDLPEKIKVYSYRPYNTQNAELNAKSMKELQEDLANSESAPPTLLPLISWYNNKRNSLKNRVVREAGSISEKLSIPLYRGVIKLNYTDNTGFALQLQNTGKKTPDPSFFIGRIQKGKNYILVDDMIKTGTTVSEMTNFIMNQGGNVIGVIDTGNYAEKAAYDLPVSMPEHTAETPEVSSVLNPKALLKHLRSTENDPESLMGTSTARSAGS